MIGNPLYCGGDFCLSGKADKPGCLRDSDNAPSEGKLIRIARALLVTAGSKGSDRKWMVHSVSEPDTACGVGKCAK